MTLKSDWHTDENKWWKKYENNISRVNDLYRRGSYDKDDVSSKKDYLNNKDASSHSHRKIPWYVRNKLVKTIDNRLKKKIVPNSSVDSQDHGKDLAVSGTR